MRLFILIYIWVEKKNTLLEYTFSAQKNELRFLLFCVCSFMFMCLDYLIEFEETGSDRKEWEELSRVSGSSQRATLPLKPFISYRFRVIAINEIGKSDPSMDTEAYSTPAARK